VPNSERQIQVTVFWVMIPCSDVVGYICFRVWSHSDQDGDNTVLWNGCILPHHYKVTIQKIMTWIFTAMKPQVSHLKDRIC